MRIKEIQRSVGVFGTILVSKLLAFYKLSFVVGSHALMFSASNLCMPLVGHFGSVSGATVVWIFLLAFRVLGEPFSLSVLAFYLPGYCAALYLATSSRLIRCGLPLLAIGLFGLHPVGFKAMMYSLFWLIPTLIGAGVGKSFFAQALGATFTAHAVGSVIWLYTVPMVPADWLSLIPLVAVERLTFAAGMVVVHAIFVSLAKFLSAKIPALGIPTFLINR